MDGETNNKDSGSSIKYISEKSPNKLLHTKTLLVQCDNVDKLCYPDMRGVTNSQETYHDECEFYILCLCKYCLEYRNDILQIFQDHNKTQKIWKIFETAFSRFYMPLLENVPKEIIEQYNYLIVKCSHWFVNGTINIVKQKHIDFILDFPWTDKMIVVIFSAILAEDDSHQLFEILSFLVECFVKQYATALTTSYKLFSDSISPAKSLLTYILTGYEKLSSIAELMSDMLFSFERNYLQNSKSFWILLNKNIYEKYFYSIIKTVVPEFMNKLKDEVSSHEYIYIITKFKKFEEVMMETKNSWQEINSKLQIYENSEDNQNRISGIKYVQTIFDMIYENNDVNLTLNQRISKNVLWEDIVSSIKKKWSNAIKYEKLKLILRKNYCICDCKSDELTSEIETSTREHNICFKCSFMDALLTKDYNFESKFSEMSLNNKLIYNNAITEINEIKNDISEQHIKGEEYHYCWAVFKHLKDRKPYGNNVINSDDFCKNCQRPSCLLAVKILNGEISYEIIKYLIKYYQPFAITNEEIMQMLPKIWLCFKKGHFPHDHYDEDFIIKIFWIFVISAYATCFAHLENKPIIPETGNLIFKNNDIELSYIKKDANLQSSDLLEFIEKIINLIQINRKAVNSSNTIANDVDKGMMLDNIIISDNTDNEDGSHILLKEVSTSNESSSKLNSNLRNVCKSDIIENFECNNASKDASSSKPPCFHEKEHRHNRKNETRDRLRKKLKKLVTVNKKPILTQKIEKPVENLNNNMMQNEHINSEICTTNNKIINHNKKDNCEMTNISLSDISTFISEDKVSSKTSRDEKWVKDALSYIEGSKNENNLVNNKKAAKRQKQKMKKEESKRIDELKDLRSQFHEVYFKEFMAKKDRKILQLSKKKDKKRILELENSVKKLSKIKLRIEKDILELISNLKSINFEFKFTYLPTKEQQEEFLQNSLRNSNEVVKPQNENIVPIKTKSHVPIVEKKEFVSLPETQHDIEISDASKRIVTIRRVNMLNNNEPQVTVTAKGSSPDEDKVLYTFINGRLVHRDSGNLSSLENSPRINFTQLSEIKNALLQNNDIMSCIDSIPNRKNTPVVKTKTQLKKERKLAKQKIADKLNEENNLNVRNQIHAVKKENNAKNFTCSEPQNQIDNSISKSEKSKLKKEISKQNQNIQKESKNPAKTICNQQQNISALNHLNVSKSCDIIKLNVNKDLEENQLKKIKNSNTDKKGKNRQIYNMKIMENNQFNLLNVDDNESFTEESESDTDTLKNKKISVQKKHTLNKNQTKIKNRIPKIKVEEKDEGFNKKKSKHKDKTINNNKNGFTNVKDNIQYSSNYTNVGKSSEQKLFGLEKAMNTLNLNAHPHNDNLLKKNDVSNISIMEQLKRGIQVENLTLPPGITLTKVNPAKAEELKAKSNPIHNLSQQMLPPQQSSVHPMFNPEHLLRTEFISPTVNKFLTDTRGVIMVDNISPKQISQKNVSQCINDSKNKTKMKKRKNRNKNKGILSDSNNTHVSKNVDSNIITLRNPMFYLSNQEGIPYCNLTDRLSQTSDSQADQPATIIRNKNGMFTIRNPVLYQNMAQSNVYNNYGGFSPNYYTSMRNGDCNPYFPENPSSSTGKCISPIGSEIKSAQQKQCTMFQNQNFKNTNFTTDCNYANGSKSFVPSDSLFYNNYCGSTSSMNINNNFRTNENQQHNIINRNEQHIQNKSIQSNNKLSSLFDLKRLSNEVTIHSMNDNSFVSKERTHVLNQRHSIEVQPIHRCEIDRDHKHFEHFNDIHIRNTDYINPNEKAILMEKESSNVNERMTKNQRTGLIESSLLPSIENNIYCNINNNHETSLFTKQEQFRSQINNT